MLFDSIIDSSKAVVQEIKLPGCEAENIWIKREDAVHPALSGNKWRKLKYNLIKAKNDGYQTLLTFGGAYSNHIYAVAAAGKLFNFNTIGIIRGEEHLPLNPTLSFAAENGMQLNYLPRSIYRRRNEAEFQKTLAAQFGEVFIIPEGGSNSLAIDGVAEMINEIDIEFDYVISAVGSGGTAAGIISALGENQKYIGIPVLKNGEYLHDIISKFLFESKGKIFNNWQLFYDFHFGGFAKVTEELLRFKYDFEQLNGLELDYIYTSKMLYALREILQNGLINKNSRIIAIHTGGLQGNRGMEERIKIKKPEVSGF